MSRDPRQFRMLSLDSWRWVWQERAYRPYHLIRYLRFVVFRLRHPRVVTEGFVFLGRGVRIDLRRRQGRIVLGAWVHLGDETSLRCQEGTLRVGEKCVLGGRVSISCHLDIEIGAATLIADSVWIGDFDHVVSDPVLPIKDQGISKAPVRIGPGSWVGTKAVVLRGAEIGSGCVIGAGSVVRGTVPDRSVAVGIPARVVKSLP